MESLKTNEKRPVGRPVSRPVVTQQRVDVNSNMVQRRPIIKEEVLYNNPKKLYTFLLFLTFIALVCFFVLPTFYEAEAFFGITLEYTFMDSLNSKGTAKTASALLLFGYSLIIFNSAFSVWSSKKISYKKTFLICNMVALVASVMSFICGFYLIFNVGYSHIALITIAVLVAITILQFIALFKCKEITIKEKIKKQYTHSDNKALTITSIVLTVLLIISTTLVLFTTKCHYYYGGALITTFEALRGEAMMFVYIALVIAIYSILTDVLYLANIKFGTSKFCFINKIVCSVLSTSYIIVSCLTTWGGGAEYFGLMNIVLSVITTVIHIVLSKRIKQISN